MPFHEEKPPGELVHITTGGLPWIGDGYVYALYYEPEANRYWLRGTGGFTGLLTHWKGPANAEHALVQAVVAMVFEALPGVTADR